MKVPSSTSDLTVAQRERSLELKVGMGVGLLVGHADREPGASPGARWYEGS